MFTKSYGISQAFTALFLFVVVTPDTLPVSEEQAPCHPAVGLGGPSRLPTSFHFLIVLSRCRGPSWKAGTGFILQDGPLGVRRKEHPDPAFPEKHLSK